MKRYLIAEEQTRLLNAAKSSTDPLAQRDYRWMQCFLHTGVRVTEWSLLTLEQAEQALRTSWLIVHKDQRKGGKRGQEYFVTQTLRTALEALCFEARQDLHYTGQADAPLVWGRDGQALSVRSYQARLKLWVTEAKLDPRVSIHWLRHSFAMNLLTRSRGKAPLKTVQVALGHVSLSSTGIYTEVSREDFMRELEQADGARLPKRVAMKRAQQGEVRA